MSRDEHNREPLLRDGFARQLGLGGDILGRGNQLSQSLEGWNVWCLGTGLSKENKGQRKLSQWPKEVARRENKFETE